MQIYIYLFINFGDAFIQSEFIFFCFVVVLLFVTIFISCLLLLLNN